MSTPIAERLGIEFPLFAFSHCRDVVAAVSKAGGYGVLGALAYSPDQLEIELSWIDDNVGGKPYGVDFAMPEKFVGKGDEFSLEGLQDMIPQEHKDHVEKILAENDVPPMPEGTEGAMKAAGLAVEVEGPGQIDVVLDHPVSMIVNALGPPPPYVVEAAHSSGVLVGALCGSARHAQRNVERGVDVLVAQGTEAGGHCGEISTMVLIPEVVDTVGPDVPVLAAGGIGRGRQMAAAMALGAQGAWTGSIWLTVRRVRHPALGRREAPGRRLRRHRPVPGDDRKARPPAPHRLDRSVGAGGRPRSPPDAAPGPPLRTRRPPLQPGPEHGPLRQPRRPDRRPHGQGPPRQGRRLRHRRGVDRDDAEHGVVAGTTDRSGARLWWLMAPQSGRQNEGRWEATHSSAVATTWSTSSSVRPWFDGSTTPHSMTRSALGRPASGWRWAMSLKPGWRRTLPVQTMRVSTPWDSMCCWKSARRMPDPVSDQQREHVPGGVEALERGGAARTHPATGRSPRTGGRSCAGGRPGWRGACAAAPRRRRRTARTARSSSRPRRR